MFDTVTKNNTTKRSAITNEQIAEIERIQKLCPDKQLLPSIMLEEASDENSPIHNQFEWDDAVCGHVHRLNQARQLIKRFEIIIIKKNNTAITAPKYISVNKLEGYKVKVEQGYIKTEVAVTDPIRKKQMIEAFKRDILRACKDYEIVDELSVVIELIRDLLK